MNRALASFLCVVVVGDAAPVGVDELAPVAVEVVAVAARRGTQRRAGEAAGTGAPLRAPRQAAHRDGRQRRTLLPLSARLDRAPVVSTLPSDTMRRVAARPLHSVGRTLSCAPWPR